MFFVRRSNAYNTNSATPNQSGQSLIETMVAIFVLVTGLISAVSLATASFQSTDNTGKQIIATALAREAVEGIRNIRDQNWLSTGDSLVACSDLGSTQKCYANWLNPTGGQNLAAGTYDLDFNTSSGQWTLRPNPPSFVLNYNNSTGSYSSQGGMGTSPSLYSRQLVITKQTAAPYTVANPLLDLKATVWWQGRTCPATSDPTTLKQNCKVILESYLTNWRNY